MKTLDTMTPDLRPRHGERGSALLLALILIIVLTFLGFGLLTRSMIVTSIAGSERWSTKTFYAADSGLAAAASRLRVRRTEPFTFQVADLRGATGTDTRGAIDIGVSRLDTVAAPQPVMGTQVGGGQGSGTEPLYMMFYKGTSRANQVLTRTERIVTATMSLGPVPLSIPE